MIDLQINRIPDEKETRRKSAACIARHPIFSPTLSLGKGFLWYSGVPRGWVLVGLARRASERKDGISVSREEKGYEGCGGGIRRKSGGTLGAASKAAGTME